MDHLKQIPGHCSQWMQIQPIFVVRMVPHSCDTQNQTFDWKWVLMGQHRCRAHQIRGSSSVQWLHGKMIIIMCAMRHKLNICLCQHKLTSILCAFYIIPPLYSSLIHSTNICWTPPICPHRWYNTEQGHASVDFAICWGTLDIYWAPTTSICGLGKGGSMKLFKC